MAGKLALQLQLLDDIADGALVQTLDFGSGPVIGSTTPISCGIKVAMILANIEYRVLQRSNHD